MTRPRGGRRARGWRKEIEGRLNNGIGADWYDIPRGTRSQHQHRLRLARSTVGSTDMPSLPPGHFYRGLPFLLRRHGTSPRTYDFAFIAYTCLLLLCLVSRWLIVPATPAQVRRGQGRGRRRGRGDDPPCMHRRETMKSVDDTRANPRCTVLSVKPTWNRVIGLSCMQRARRSVSAGDGYTARWHADTIVHGPRLFLSRESWRPYI